MAFPSDGDPIVLGVVAAGDDSEAVELVNYGAAFITQYEV